MRAPLAGRPPVQELVLLRHAEAERKADSDLLRALTGKGREEATHVGKLLASGGILPDRVLTSPATRALETARLAASAWGEPAPEVVERIYDASLKDLSAVLARQEGAQRILIVGHNPGLSDLATWLASLPPGWSLGKGSAAHLRVRATWQDLSRGCGRLVDVLGE